MMSFGKKFLIIAALLLAGSVNFAFMPQVLADGEQDSAITGNETGSSMNQGSMGGGVNGSDGEDAEKPENPKPNPPENLNDGSIDYSDPEEPAVKPSVPPTNTDSKPNTTPSSIKSATPTVKTTNKPATTTKVTAAPQSTSTAAQAQADTTTSEAAVATDEPELEPLVPETATAQPNLQDFGWVIGAVVGAITAAAIVSAMLFKKFGAKPEIDEII